MQEEKVSFPSFLVTVALSYYNTLLRYILLLKNKPHYRSIISLSRNFNS